MDRFAWVFVVFLLSATRQAEPPVFFSIAFLVTTFLVVVDVFLFDIFICYLEELSDQFLR